VGRKGKVIVASLIRELEKGDTLGKPKTESDHKKEH